MGLLSAGWGKQQLHCRMALVPASMQPAALFTLPRGCQGLNLLQPWDSLEQGTAMKGWIFLLPGISLQAVLAGWAAVPGLLGLLGELEPGSGKPAGAALLPPKQGSGSAPVPGIVLP